MKSETDVLPVQVVQQPKGMLKTSRKDSSLERFSEVGPTEPNAFRERLRELTRDVGSEAELERRAGLPLGLVSHYTRTHRPSDPSRSNVVRLALAGGVSIAWLAAGIGPKRGAM